MAESSLGPKGHPVWSKLWNLHVPNKIKVFGWCACQEILPSRVNLARRKIITDNTCECCKRVPEIGIHLLWECGAAQDVWARSKVRLYKHTRGQANIIQLFQSLLDRLSPTEFELFLVQA